MKILFLHGWQSVPGGVKPSYLANHGHTVINPKLPDDDMLASISIAQNAFDHHRPDVVVGSSRGGAVALNLQVGNVPRLLLCPAWKKYSPSINATTNTIILHSRADDVIPFADSEELQINSGLPATALIEVGHDHRLADPVSLATMLQHCELLAPIAAGIRPATLRTASQGTTVVTTGDIYRFLATGADTNQRYAMWEAIVPPGGGPPPHIHRNEEESFYILEGEITFQIGDRTLVATSGMFANMPVGLAHSFRNCSTAPAKMIISVMPAGLEQMFFEVGKVVPTGTTTAAPPSKEEIGRLIQVAPKYGIELLLAGH